VATNVPFLTFTPAGPVAPLESAIEAGVQADFQAAFGGTLNFTTNSGSNTNPTPQAQLADSETAIIGQNNDLFLLFCNLVDPALSYGRMHDAIGRISYVTRFSGTPTQVTVQCIGGQNVVIPIGALLLDVNNNQWTAVQTATIPNIGTVNVLFACTVNGPVACPAGALNSSAGAQIVNTIAGWDAINNSAAGIVGANEETDQAFEARRYRSTAANSTGWQDSMVGALLAVPGVIDAYVITNPSVQAAVILGVTVTAYSSWIVVEGGAQAAIAQAIFTTMPPSMPMCGNTSFTVYDTQQGYTAPYPSYTMTWQTPAQLPISVNVTIANLPTVPTNALSLIQAAIVLAFSGQDQQGYNSVGQPIYGPLVTWPTLFKQRLAQALNSFTTWNGIQVVDIAIGSPNNADAMFTGTVATAGPTTTLTVSAMLSGALVIGDTLMDILGNVSAGATILSQTSGTPGGVGAYVLSQPMTIATGQTMYSVAANQAEIQITLAQFPTIAANNITMALQ